MCADKNVHSSFVFGKTESASILTIVYYLQWKKIYKVIRFLGKAISSEICSSGHMTDLPVETRMDLA